MTRYTRETFSDSVSVLQSNSAQENLPSRILVVEDDEQIADFVCRGLLEAGFAVKVVGDGLEGFELAKRESYSVLVLDIMLPGISGLELLRRIRSLGINTHVLILSGKGSVNDRVAGLELGADDYLTKPFAFAELLARIQCLLRRDRGVQEPVRLAVSDLILDLLNQKALRGNEEIDLQPQEFRLLKYLMLNEGRIVNRTQILQSVWGYNFHPSTNLVEVHICRLREKIERTEKPKLLRTVRGAGYILSDNDQAL